MLNKLFILKFGLILLFNNFNIIKSQDACTAVRNQPGQCIFLTNCAVYYNIITTQLISPDQRKMILDSSCGTVNGQHKVCCPTAAPLTQATSVGPSTTTTRVSNEPILTNMDYSNHKSAQLLDPTICGNGIDNKIANGNLTEILQYPWMAILQYQTGDGIIQGCGGTAISKRYVLTAAHCVLFLRGGKTVHSVILGEHNTLTEVDCDVDDPTYCADPIQTIDLERIIAHPLYNRRNYTNDIALIRLKHDIDFSTETVRPICLPVTLTQQITVPIVKVTGWGKTEKGSTSPILLQADLEIVNNSACGGIYRLRTGLNIIATHLCAGTGVSDSCEGDSGGPAIYPVDTTNGPRYVQYGIVAAGIDTCGDNPGLPGLYTRVIPYMKWILDNMTT